MSSSEAEAEVRDEAWKRFHERYLAPKLAETAADVSKAGFRFTTTFHRPTTWTEPFPPAVVSQPVLPDESGYVGSRQVEIDSPEGASMLRRPHAAHGTREFVRGSMAAMPFAPGGEALQVSTTAAQQAAEEARSGKWLEELESGKPLRAHIPGMDRGAFGAWALAEAEDLKEGAAEDQLESKHSADGVSEPYAAPSERSAHQQAGPGHNGQAVDLSNLFAGIWMEDNDHADSDDADGQAEAPPLENGKGPKPTLLSRIENLPEDLLDSGAVGRLEARSLAPKTAAARSGKVHVPASLPTTTGRNAASALVPKSSARTQWAVRGAIKNVNADFERLRPDLAHVFPFELDGFQKEALIHLERGDSVFVAAHTSAGKTAVAEYAMALAAKHCTRSIYTSPIKTISNQKFRDFGDQFEVGLLTGDVSIKPESACLIMTTEILRSMLYKGADIIRDIEWVIFDEVHYVNDAERGVVWEEVIIMLPAHVNLILLSATVPNVMEFADWVGRTKRKVIHVTGTTRRPVPLEHNLYYGGQLYTICRAEAFLSEGVAAAKSAWKKKNAPPVTKKDEKRARPTGRGDGGPQGQRGGRQGGAQAHGRRGGGAGRAVQQLQSRGGGVNSNSGVMSERAAWMALVEDLKKRQLLPTVVFCFSKKRVDALADNLSRLDLAMASEKAEVHIFCERALGRLRGTDRQLPQIRRLREMLARGLGVHHAGLLPIMKEVVEMLFCKGLIKVLFSTETFAMGVNAPARCVIFQSLRKHDGKEFRNLLPGEYTQMAGRAGRRGLDPVGTVIIACWDDVYDEGEMRRLLTGKATRLESQFRLTYSMILNLLRVEDLKVEDMLKRSFAEFHAQRAAPEALEALQKGQERLLQLRARPWPHSFQGTSRQDVEQYHNVGRRIEELSGELQESVMNSRAAAQALVPGRVVLIADRSSGLAELGVVCGSAPAAKTGIQLGSSPAAGATGRQYYVASLHQPTPVDSQEEAAASQSAAATANGALPGSFQAPAGFVLKGTAGRGGTIGPGKLPRRGNLGDIQYILQEVDVAHIEAICKAKLKVDPDTVLDPETPQTLIALVRKLQSLQEEAESEGAAQPAMMDPISDLKLNQLDIVDLVRERQALLQVALSWGATRLLTVQARADMACYRDPALGEMYALVRSEALLEDRLNRLKHQVSDASLAQMPDFNQRVQVLRQLDYISAEDVVELKGRVACEINSGDELVATEVIFAGVLAELEPEEAVALLSALVFQEKVAEEPATPTAALGDALDHTITLALQAGQVQRDCGLDILPEDFLKATLKFGLVEVVYHWAKGMPFKDICELTDVLEGSIVRAIVRLDETCREFRDAGKVMGNTALVQQMEAASAAIKRDVIFAASLYVA